MTDRNEKPGAIVGNGRNGGDRPGGMRRLLATITGWFVAVFDEDRDGARSRKVHAWFMSAFEQEQYYGGWPILRRLIIFFVTVPTIGALSWVLLNALPFLQKVPEVDERLASLATIAIVLLAVFMPWYKMDPFVLVFSLVLVLGFVGFLATACVFLYRMMNVLTSAGSSAAPPLSSTIDQVLKSQLSLLSILVSTGGVTDEVKYIAASDTSSQARMT